MPRFYYTSLLHFLLFAAALFFAGAFILPLRASAAGPVPDFAIQATVSGWHWYSASSYTQISETEYTYDDSYVSATVTALGQTHWRLDINNAKVSLSSVTFPWQTQRISLDADLSDDIYYYPYIMGMTWKAAERYINHNWAFWGRKYPGFANLPLAIIADADDARIVAAINWPPKSVTPYFGSERLILQYDQPIPVGGSASYEALIATVTGNANEGSIPWQNALDLYKSWLASAMEPVTYPAWMWDGQGILNVQLNNLTETLSNHQYSIAFIDSVWQPVKNLYPWVLMWGQMSHYAGDCCDTSYTMHKRYLTAPTLPDYVDKTIVAGGYHAGYYSAPNWHDQTTYSLDKQPGVDWLTGWISANRGHGANSFYVDTLARVYWGEAAAVKALMDNSTIPHESMLEGVVDIYPRPGLISGCLTGDENAPTAPFMRPENHTKTSFPNFVRYALGDRLVYEGQSNTDWKFWGNDQGWNQSDNYGYTAYCAANGPCEYGTERLAFLLGAKVDVQTHSVRGNPILDAINVERQRVDWWTRRPVYLDTKDLNLTTVPASSKVEVSRFQDKTGVDLLAVSNPNLVSGLTFTLNGASVAVPVQKIAVVELGNRKGPAIRQR